MSVSQYAESMVALVTGAGKGLGEAICELLMERGFSRVAVTARDRAEAVAVAARLGDKAKGFALDVTSDASVAECLREVREAFGAPVAFLVNNAGSHYDNGAHCSELKAEDFLAAMSVNLLGLIRMTSAVLPEMKRLGFGRIVNVTSRSGSFAGSWKNAPCYGVSKCAANMYTLQLAADLTAQGHAGVLANACCPGWLRTRMGGEQAVKSAAEGAATPVFLCMLADETSSQSGSFFGEGKEIGW